MCTGVEIAYLLAASAAVSVAGTMIVAEGQKEQANAQAQASINDAAYEADAYKQQADKIRRAGKEQVGATNAALAASGVKLAEGTPLELKKTIIQRSEEDAMTAILNGGRATSAGAEQASIYGKAGKNAMTAGYAQSASTVLGAAVDYNRGGWKKG